jgi:hypothetical protein
MLSRNLYEISEVVAALQQCLRNAWPRALFWAWELTVSEEFELLNKTLKDAWFDYGAPHDPDLLELTDTIAMTLRIINAIKMTGSMAPIKMLDYGKLNVRPRVTPATKDAGRLMRRRRGAEAFVKTLSPTETITHEEAARFWISFYAAARCGWYRDVFWLLQAGRLILSDDAIWSALVIAGGPRFKCSANPIDQIRAQAASAATLCARPTVPNLPDVRRATRDWEFWNSQVGYRSARMYSINEEALHKETTRGSIPSKYTNIQDIREPILLLTSGCAWWRRVSAAAGFMERGDTMDMPEDEEYEAFYEMYFPDDIPDEWSTVDQQKSHGRGLAEKAVEQDIPFIRVESIAQREWIWGIHVPSWAAKS